MQSNLKASQWGEYPVGGYYFPACISSHLVVCECFSVAERHVSRQSFLVQYVCAITQAMCHDQYNCICLINLRNKCSGLHQLQMSQVLWLV